MQLKSEEVYNCKIPKGSSKAVANAMRAFALTYMPVYKPIAYVIEEGTTAHVDGVSEELYRIHMALSKLNYAFNSIVIGHMEKRTYEFRGIVTTENITQFIPEAVVEDLDNDIIMTVVGNKAVKISIVFLCANGSRTVMDNTHLLEERKIVTESDGKIKPFSSNHEIDMIVSFDRKELDSYYDRVYFSASHPKYFMGSLNILGEIIKGNAPAIGFE